MDEVSLPVKPPVVTGRDVKKIRHIAGRITNGYVIIKIEDGHVTHLYELLDHFVDFMKNLFEGKN